MALSQKRFDGRNKDRRREEIRKEWFKLEAYERPRRRPSFI